MVLAMVAVAGDKLMINHETILKLIGNIQSIYDVRIDKEVTDIRHGLSEIGIRSKLEDGGLDLDLFDAMLSYISSNTRVILELDFKHNLVASDAVIESQSTEYDISILPPEFDGSESEEDQNKAWDDYGQKLCDFAEAWLQQSNTSQQVYPIAGYIGYMVAEVFGHKPKSISEDPYIRARFVDPIPLDVMDRIKDMLKVTIYEQFGGKDEFEVYANSLAATSAQYFGDTVEQIAKELELDAAKEKQDKKE